eukprot:gene2324-2782_t
MIEGCLSDAAVIRIPDQYQEEIPLQILFVSTSSAITSFPRLLLSLGVDSHLKLKQSYISVPHSSNSADGGTDRPPFQSINVGCTTINLAPGATLDHTYAQELSVTTRHVDVVTADVPARARYNLVVLQTGARVSRVNVHMNLTTATAFGSLSGVTVSSRDRSLDLHSSITHSDADTHSEQLQRNIIGDGGEAIFKGRIRMPQVAQQSSSSQLCRSLLLGNFARLQAMPVLEIWADDVSCSHGVAVTDLDENAMFYLSARGINRAEARRLLLSSFVLELLLPAIMDEKAQRRLKSLLVAFNPSEENLEAGSQ